MADQKVLATNRKLLLTFHIEKSKQNFRHLQVRPDQMILSHTPKCYACLVYDSLSKNRFQEKSGKEIKDDNYTKYSRGLSELHQRALFVNNPSSMSSLVI